MPFQSPWRTAQSCIQVANAAISGTRFAGAPSQTMCTVVRMNSTSARVNETAYGERANCFAARPATGGSTTSPTSPEGRTRVVS